MEKHSLLQTLLTWLRGGSPPGEAAPQAAPPPSAAPAPPPSAAPAPPPSAPAQPPEPAPAPPIDPLEDDGGPVLAPPPPPPPPPPERDSRQKKRINLSPRPLRVESCFSREEIFRAQQGLPPGSSLDGMPAQIRCPCFEEMKKLGFLSEQPWPQTSMHNGPYRIEGRCCYRGVRPALGRPLRVGSDQRIAPLEAWAGWL